MKEYKFKIGGCDVEGTCFDSEGNLSDFSGHLKRTYTDLSRASVAARRKYNDQTISVLSITPTRHTYVCDFDKLLEISTIVD